MFSLVKLLFRSLSFASMARKVFLGIRIDPELKRLLEEIGQAEERSLSQICELLLRKGASSYKKEGPRYLQASVLTRKKDQSE